ncbi:MAG: hypothetical protein PHN69_03815 [Candidatus Pacebacteria bacterium]|nr:hypothetical protein [Candidatus Paceibacterota bacterium]
MEHQVTINGKEYTLTLNLQKYFQLTQKMPDLQVKLFTGQLGTWGSLDLFAKLANVKTETITDDPEFLLKHVPDYEYALLEVFVPFFKEQGILDDSMELPSQEAIHQIATEAILEKISML